LDTLGVINTWYFTGKNRLYFYGFDSTYYQYNSTTTLDDNPKLKPRGNVTGGRGFFSAAVVDSFDVMITGDPADKQYPLTLTQGLSCGEDGWFDNLDCRDYYQSYCELKESNVKRCGASAIMTCAEKNEDTAVFKGLCKTGGIADSVRKIPGVEYDARIRYCTDNNFPTEKTFCEPIKKECEAGSGVNQCKTILWQMCEQRSWQPEACKDARITYCRDSVKPAVAACKGVKTK